ncbi:MAG: tyrosine-type recombinase/integrase [Flavobacteriaceae bacterium]|nr:tyrosine-type recombinase/integrase [Flavobacteriaceae bacterium]
MDLDAFIAYLQHEKKYSMHTVKAYKGDIDAFMAFGLDRFQLNDATEINYPMIRSWVVELVGQGRTNRSINRKVASLKAYFKFLLAIGTLTADPLAKHKALKTKKQVQVPFSEAELKEVLEQLPFEASFEGMRDRAMIELLYATGMRRAEMIALKMSDIDMERQMVKVLGKRNKERIIPVLDTTKTTLKEYLDARELLPEIADPSYLFLTKTGHKIYETLVYRVINKYFSMVSPKAKRSPHIVRHTFATHLLNEGADLNTVKELLGHSSLASTQVYTHNSIAELKKAHLAAHPRSKE